MRLRLDVIVNQFTACRIKSDLAGGIDKLPAADRLTIWAYPCWSISCKKPCTVHKHFPRLIKRLATSITVRVKLVERSLEISPPFRVGAAAPWHLAFNTLHILASGTAPGHRCQVESYEEPTEVMAWSDLPAPEFVILSRSSATPAASRLLRGTDPLAPSPRHCLQSVL